MEVKSEKRGNKKEKNSDSRNWEYQLGILKRFIVKSKRTKKELGIYFYNQTERYWKNFTKSTLKKIKRLFM
jgi:hypothetical protein